MCFLLRSSMFSLYELHPRCYQSLYHGDYQQLWSGLSAHHETFFFVFFFYFCMFFLIFFSVQSFLFCFHKFLFFFLFSNFSCTIFFLFSQIVCSADKLHLEPKPSKTNIESSRQKSTSTSWYWQHHTKIDNRREQLIQQASGNPSATAAARTGRSVVILEGSQHQPNV